MQLNGLSLFLTKKNTTIFFVCLLTLMVLGTTIILVTTRLGAGISDDSYYYIKPVRDFLSGNIMILHPAFPPLVNYTLIVPGMFGVDPLVSIRFLNALLFGASIFLSGIILKRNTHSIVYSLLGAFILLVSRVLIEVHSEAMSEPLYLFLSLLAFCLLDRYIQTNGLQWFFLSSVMSALALLTRYAGITVIFACFFVLTLSTNGAKYHRVRRAIIFLAISLLPIVIYRFFLTESYPIGSRLFVDLRYMLEFNRITSAFYNMITWFLPGRIVKGIEVYIVLILFLSTVAICGYYWFTNKEKFKLSVKTYLLTPIGIVFFAWALTNLLLLYLGQGFLFGAGDAFNNRYLSPVYLAVILLIISITAMFWQIAGKISRYFITFILGSLIVSFMIKASGTIIQLHENGIGYASARWHISETIAYLNKHPDIPVMGTAGVGIYFWTGKLPLAIQSPTETHKWLRSTGGYLVIIDSMPLELYGIDKNELVSGLQLLYQFSEGSIYQYPKQE